MLFNSIDFAVFLPVVFAVYWLFSPWLKVRNLIIIASSYVFYGWWDWRFLSLIVFSTLIDFVVGGKLGREQNPLNRKLLLVFSIFSNLGLLGFFKYYNFFIENFTRVFTFFGSEISTGSLNIILPVGISFYTFQTLSYTIDIYRRQMKPTDDLIAFAAFVSFFPQLVAGPIERAKRLLPQITSRLYFDYSKAADGMRQILWGLFKKIVIADSCAEIANVIFQSPESHSSGMLIFGVVLFAFQIYGDFSGYSDIAIGTARLFGIDLMKNFAFPYFSRDMAEFWRRWHISLSTWFRDYVYIPLGGSRSTKAIVVRNTFIIFIVSGLWHGANWTFVVWGALNAVYFLPLLLAKKNRLNLDIVAKNKIFPGLRETAAMLLTFFLTCLAWVFFRAESLSHAFLYIKSIFMKHEQIVLQDNLIQFNGLLIFIALFLVLEWRGRDTEYALEKFGIKWPPIIRWLFYYAIVIVILWHGGKEQQFIYFQF